MIQGFSQLLEIIQGKRLLWQVQVSNVKEKERFLISLDFHGLSPMNVICEEWDIVCTNVTTQANECNFIADVYLFIVSTRHI